MDWEFLDGLLDRGERVADSVFDYLGLSSEDDVARRLAAQQYEQLQAMQFGQQYGYGQPSGYQPTTNVNPPMDAAPPVESTGGGLPSWFVPVAIAGAGVLMVLVMNKKG